MKSILKKLSLPIVVIGIALGCSENNQKETVLPDSTEVKTNAIETQPIDSVYFADIAGKPLTDYIDPYNIQNSDDFLSQITVPEQYYIRTWMAHYFPEIYKQYGGDEMKMREIMSITFHQVSEDGRILAEKNGMNASDLQKSFENQ